jgi:hypothetical protein
MIGLGCCGAAADAMLERWLPIPGWDGAYEVSNFGRVRSLPRRVGNGTPSGRRVKGGVLAQLEKDGYMTVLLKRPGKQSRVTVNRVMLLAFDPVENSASLQACHRNGKRSDNRLANLRWDDHAGNAADRSIHGTALLGDRHPNARLTADAVRAIRASQEPARSLAERFGVSQSVVVKARLRQTWRHVE